MSTEDVNAALQHAREDLTSMARELVALQDRLEAQDAELHEARHRLAQYDSDSLALSKQLASDNTTLRAWLARIRSAHTRSHCAEENCPLCAALYPQPELVRAHNAPEWPCRECWEHLCNDCQESRP